MEYLKRQKEQAANKNKYEQFVNQYNSSENIFYSVNQALNKFI